MLAVLADNLTRTNILTGRDIAINVLMCTTAIELCSLFIMATNERDYVISTNVWNEQQNKIFLADKLARRKIFSGRDIAKNVLMCTTATELCSLFILATNERDYVSSTSVWNKQLNKKFLADNLGGRKILTGRDIAKNVWMCTTAIELCSLFILATNERDYVSSTSVWNEQLNNMWANKLLPTLWCILG